MRLLKFIRLCMLQLKLAHLLLLLTKYFLTQLTPCAARNVGDYICGWYLHKVMS